MLDRTNRLSDVPQLDEDRRGKRTNRRLGALEALTAGRFEVGREAEQLVAFAVLFRERDQLADVVQLAERVLHRFHRCDGLCRIDQIRPRLRQYFRRISEVLQLYSQL